jgi:superfamily I DNA/RNA helicase
MHVMTMNEAQGVEFDAVAIVGIGKDMFAVREDAEHRDLAEEKKRINKDLLYVALTRAISELHVMGKEKLENATSEYFRIEK